MKRLLICSFAAVLAATGSADQAQAAPISQDSIQYCQTISDIGQTIMQARQGGVAMGDLMGFTADDPGMQAIVQNMIIAAYRWTFAHSEQGKATSIQQFENKTFADCLDAVMK